jgi:malate dehydrogenase (oxaloacetate-decarboxylating)(NADP+)
MKPVFAMAKRGAASKSACFTPKARDERVLRAVRAVVDEGLARPVLIGRPAVIDMRIEKCGLNLKAGRDFDVVNPSPTRATASCGRSTTASWAAMASPRIRQRRPCVRDSTLIGCMLLRRGDATR